MTSNTSHPEEGNLLDDDQVSTISETLSGLLDVSASSSKCSNGTLDGAVRILESVLHQWKDPTQEHNVSGDGMEPSLGNWAVMVAQRLCTIPRVESSSHRKQSWQTLQFAAEKLQHGSSLESSALAISLVFGALSLLQVVFESCEITGLDAKAAASAISSTTSRNKPLRNAGQSLSTMVLRSYLVHASHSDSISLHILNHFAKAFKLGGDVCIEHEISANVIVQASRETVHNTYARMLVVPDNQLALSKRRVSSALALACQLEPWTALSPESLVEAAIPYELWQAAEEICRSAFKSSSTGSSQLENNGSVLSRQNEQHKKVIKAVERLIDAAMEDRMYRRADALATSLYEAGGRSRYVEARFGHARETISKVIFRRQIHIVDRQIERIDKAVAKVQQDEEIYGAAIPSPSLSFDPCNDIRKFAIGKLEEAGDISSARRLASLFGFEYTHDERAVMLAVAKRRQRYMQFEDVLDGAIPSLVATPKDLLDAFALLQRHPYSNGPFGFDAEWDEDTNGAAVLQLANAKMAVLVDVPILLGTAEGVKAMETTVGKLLNCEDAVVAGFACRQDVQRLLSSPFVGRRDDNHWLSGARAVVDVQNLIANAEPNLVKVGLSRACQNFLGKPLDKAEQCSLWSGRPLSVQQRAYAAMDAWVCVAIYKKLNNVS